MVNNSSQICLTISQMELYGNEMEKYLQRLLYPLVAIFGVTGNVLNLTVLLNRSSRSRSNIFLAALAVADIIFLLLLTPNILATYPVFTYNYFYRYIYFHIKIHLLSLTNWVSSTAIWLMIAVCANRLIGIMRPLHAKTDWNQYRISLIIAAIIIMTGIVNFYQHFQYVCLIRHFCYGTQIYSKCRSVNNDRLAMLLIQRWFRNGTNPYPTSYRRFIDISITVNAVTTIILPIFLLSFLNVLLLCTLRNRRVFLLVASNQKWYKFEFKFCSSTKKSSTFRYLKTEHHVTMTVALIVTAFIILNGPSAVIHLVNLAHKRKLNYNFILLGNTLVIINKACNFILFCLTSEHFRGRLFKLTQKKVSRRMRMFSTISVKTSSNIRQRVQS
ncbi:unnamed protein product [Thelazia callipaeda]|uniref:G_PROTEIN_RECEP_F1_2 domain-containing protein n=1 Tax=Thelazia callipaeda TaxID=103827 RepID=A0A0N5CP22_THECL|nr:unnamed protein product [Thelazia callipaeda]